MKRITLGMLVGALLLVMVAGVASAATFVCDSNPCFGTNNDDMIGEQDERGASDDIRARDGADQINARRAGECASPGRCGRTAGDGAARDGETARARRK